MEVAAAGNRLRPPLIKEIMAPSIKVYYVLNKNCYI